MPRILFALFLLALLRTAAAGQITGISHAYGNGPASRGSVAAVLGVNLAADTVYAPDPFTLPTTLSGVSVSIDGLPCLIRSISPTRVVIVVPDNVPPSRYVLTRFGWWISPQVLRVTGVMSYEYKFHLTDSAPWWELWNGSPIGAVMSYTGPVDTVGNGIIPYYPNTTVQLRASGCRSSYPAEWIFYRVWFYVPGEGAIDEVDATLSRDVIQPGVDLVKFAPKPEWAGKTGLLFLQTPSNFSAGVEVTFKPPQK